METIFGMINSIKNNVVNYKNKCENQIVSIPNFIVVQRFLVCFDALSLLHEYLMKKVSIPKINARIEVATSNN